ncbi:zinc finger protein 20-like [Acipenser ruthenus]|uniref:zinc finger protein 20-like n=1 Tax=Acipenser ruthenus TaxID=7906 RepID=UPI002742338E|nr:zinc finger protein 20-like [Acipenser ruthenus]XP_058891641.1 zinc finger protein 20-like [Acipenser ruthenus]
MLSWKCYNCERCGSDFASPTALKQHFRARHAGKEMCDRCGSEVAREKLQEHKQVAHYEETHGAQKPLVRAAPLRRESRFLASETSVTCRMCRRAFGTSFGREQHERQDHHFTASKRGKDGKGAPHRLQYSEGVFHSLLLCHSIVSHLYQTRMHQIGRCSGSRMSTGFSPNNIVDMRSSQQLRQFVETRLRPESGLMKTACAGEVEALVELIEQCCPVPVSRVVKVREPHVCLH